MRTDVARPYSDLSGHASAARPARSVGLTDATTMERGVTSMYLRRFLLRTQRREFVDMFQPNEEPLESGNSGHERHISQTGAPAAGIREIESEWPWWLSSPTTGAAAPSRGSDGESDIARRWSLQQDETDEPTSLPAA